jgi:transposase
MNRKSESVHLDIRADRKNPYALIRNSYREDGKVKKETLGSIRGLPLEQLRAIQAAMQGKMVMKDDFIISNSREHGASFACVELMKELGLDRAVYSRPGEEWVRSSLAMVAGRLVYAGSKLSLSHCGAHSTIWEVCGVSGGIDVNTHCYDAMDKLYSRQDAIQKKLAAKHLEGGTLVLYDITSSYMEGGYEDSSIVEFGYNRDRKRGHEQIVISLLCNKDGCPVAVEVFSGNTKDESTVLDKINEIQKKYGFDKIIFVGDRGMVTQANYKKINHDLVKVVTALNHDTIQALCRKDVIQISMFDEKDIVEVIDGDARYCLCLNPEMAKKEGATRQALLRKTQEELDKIIAGDRKVKTSKGIRAGKVVGKYKMGKFIIFEGADDNLTYRLDHAKIEQEALLDGCYVIFTDVPAAEMAAAEAVANYKSLMKVEQAFRNMKTVRLEVRPVYHKTDDRIKCHVFICLLAYYVMWHMNQRLKPLFDSDGKGKDRKYTFDYVMESLKGIRLQDVEVCGVKSAVVSKPTVEQSQILSLLGVAI